MKRSNRGDKREVERRQKAHLLLAEFNQFLRLGQKRGSRNGLSPAKALEHLHNTDVTDLLAPRTVDEIRFAANLLS